MKKGDTVFDIHGNEYEYSQKLEEGGFVVYAQYGPDSFGDGYAESWTDDAPRIIDKVFSEPPTQKLRGDIASLEQQKADTEKALRELQAETRLALAERNAAFGRLAQIEPLKTLQACIEGKITHVVKSGWGNVEILTPSDQEERDGRGYFTPLFGLLTLFGNSRGDLQWKINQYYDSSGSSYQAYPCASLEMAQEKAREMFSEIMAEASPNRRYLENAIELGIHIAPEYRQAVEAKERKEAQEAVKEAWQKLEEKEAALVALTN